MLLNFISLSRLSLSSPVTITLTIVYIRILANYMVWHLIKPLIPNLSKPFRDAYSQMLKAEKGLEIIDRSWRSCVAQTDSVFGFATGLLFVKENGLSAVQIRDQVIVKQFY